MTPAQIEQNRWIDAVQPDFPDMTREELKDMYNSSMASTFECENCGMQTKGYPCESCGFDEEDVRTMTQEQTTEQEFELYHDKFFDRIEEQIEILGEMLNTELEITEDESEHADDLKERIAHLRERMAAGDAYVDNDITSSPDAWKTLATYTEAEARAQYQEWDN